MARRLYMEDEEFFAKMRRLVDEIEGSAGVGDIDSVGSAVDDLGAALGELQEFIDFAKEQ